MSLCHNACARACRAWFLALIFSVGGVQCPPSVISQPLRSTSARSVSPALRNTWYGLAKKQLVVLQPPNLKMNITKKQKKRGKKQKKKHARTKITKKKTCQEPCSLASMTSWLSAQPSHQENCEPRAGRQCAATRMPNHLSDPPSHVVAMAPYRFFFTEEVVPCDELPFPLKWGASSLSGGLLLYQPQAVEKANHGSRHPPSAFGLWEGQLVCRCSLHK